MTPSAPRPDQMPAAAKKAWRELLREARRHYVLTKGASIDDDYRQMASFAQPLLSLFAEFSKPVDPLVQTPISSSLIIASYRAMAHEFDPTPLEDALRLLGHRVVWPRVEAKQLRFFADDASPPFTLSKYGIQEPSVGASEYRPNIVLVPLVGLDRDGFRLGQGGGFYDQTLPHLRTFSVGLGFSCQFVERLPREPHDVPLNAALTPLELYQFSQSRH
jgi:5-formyltetrahydrofolate cyclo-ligase